VLNSKNIRELAYVAEIKSIDPIVGSDNCESASIDGWHVMVRKNTFKVGDKCVYFEIDSKLDTNEPMFAFLEKCKGKIRTQKYTFGGKGNFISQGLIMRLEECGLDYDKYKVGDFLTETLNVKYAEDEDNKRKANDRPQYKASFNKIKKNRIIKYLMRFGWFRKLIFAIFGVHKKKKNYPWFVVKSDEERCQNEPQSVFDDKSQTYEITEKIDGTSSTYAIERLHGNKYQVYICSRNVVVFDGKKIKEGGYYKDIENPYMNSDKQYNILISLTDYMNKNKEVKWCYLQGETFGNHIQKRDYSLKEIDFRAFTFVDSTRPRYTYSEMKEILDSYNIPTVPILQTRFTLPNSCDELLSIAGGKSEIDGGMREGIVLRSEQNPQFSFKAVDNEFLLKYHG
jgi:hypothetical protein